MTESIGKNDVIVQVELPLKDYLIMRELIEERQAMNGLRKWLQNKVFWLAGGVLTLLGVFEILRRIGE
jgi:hypothetical protein